MSSEIRKKNKSNLFKTPLILINPKTKYLCSMPALIKPDTTAILPTTTLSEHFNKILIVIYLSVAAPGEPLKALKLSPVGRASSIQISTQFSITFLYIPLYRCCIVSFFLLRAFDEILRYFIRCFCA